MSFLSNGNDVNNYYFNIVVTIYIVLWNTARLISFKIKSWFLYRGTKFIFSFPQKYNRGHRTNELEQWDVTFYYLSGSYLLHGMHVLFHSNHYNHYTNYYNGMICLFLECSIQNILIMAIRLWHSTWYIEKQMSDKTRFN